MFCREGQQGKCPYIKP